MQEMVAPRRGRAAALLALALAGSACVQRSGGAAQAAPGEPAAWVAPSSLPPPAAVPRGVSLLGEGGESALQLTGATSKVTLRAIEVVGQPFSRALEAAVVQPGQSPGEVQLVAPTVAPVQKDDALLATFFVRAEREQAAGGGETELVFELAGAPYTRSVSYPVPVTAEWRKVQVRFRAAGDHAAGRARLLFRLGYAPQTLQLGGLSLESFGKSVQLTKLPTTQGIDRKLAAHPPAAAPRLPAVDAGELRFQIQPSKVIRKISPLVYGLNSQPIAGTGATVRRNGGNRGSLYNWETNFSNAGRDYLHQNDRWPCTVMQLSGCSQPAGQYLGFFEQNRAASAETLVTVPLLDYVAADDAGPVRPEDEAPSARFLASRARKGRPFAQAPDLKDRVVYQDELVAYLVGKLGKAEQGGIRFYSLDNEPALWPQTHPLVHPKPTTYAEIARRSEELAAAIKDVDPSAFVIGGVMSGWAELQSLGGAPDAAQHKALGTYVEFLLDVLKRAEQKHGKRLVDALDVHWYPEVRGTQRITTDDASSATVEERLQAPRSLWDPTYTEKSWIAQQAGGPIRLIPWLRDLIQKRYPGTQLTLTEYNYGGTREVSGALAQVDVLGVLGREGVHLATYWGSGAAVEALPPYVAAAFELYRNYDGKGGRFGDTAVPASTSSNAAASIFAATAAAGQLTVIAINKHQQHRYTGVFDLAGSAPYRSVKSYVLDREGTRVRPGKAAQLSGSTLRHVLEPLSATLLVFQRD